MKKETDYFFKMPFSIVENKDLSIMDKLLFGIVLNLTNKTGICTASNAYLSEKINVSTRTIDRSLKALEDNKLIIRNNIYAENAKNVIRRDIKIVSTNLVKGIDNLSKGIDKKGEEVSTNLVKGIDIEVVDKRLLKEDNKRDNNASLHFASLSDLIFNITTKRDTKIHQPIKVIKQFDEYLQQFEYETDEDKKAVDNVLDIGYSFIKYRDYMFNESNQEKKFKLVTKKSVIDFINTICNEFPNSDLEILFDKMEAKSWASIEKGWKI